MAEKYYSIYAFNNIPSFENGQYPSEFVEKNGVLLLNVTEDTVTIGYTEKTSDEAKSILKTYHTQKTEFVLLQYTELTSWLSRQFSSSNSEAANSLETSSDDLQLLDKLANDAPIVNLVNTIVIDAIRQNASDIHIEAEPAMSRVRYRIDGILKTVMHIDKRQIAAVSSRIKIMANLNILEKRLPQDGRITVSIGKETADLRVSIIPVSGGESIVLRILGKATSDFTLENLGFSNNQLALIKNMIKIPHGLILVTGPTGSGKTTTLNAIMKELVSEETKIISIEDPVEFIVNGVNQIQINEQINLGFDVILRRVLRHDPNVIMVGEIRDRVTAELAVRAALTGHLVLSTLHTNDAVSVVSRLENMGIEPFLIGSVLKGAIAQRLVRKLSKEQNSAKADAPVFSGRIIISETFSMTPELETLIQNQVSKNELMEYLKSQNMIFMKDDAVEKIQAGLTTRQEAEREILF